MKDLDVYRMTIARRRLLGVALAGGASAMAGPAVTLARQESASTPDASPDASPEASPVAAALPWTPNPWEPDWSPDPDLFTVVRREGDTVTVRTPLDGEIALPANPQRIVCVTGEEDILFALGLGDRVASVAGYDGAPGYTSPTVIEHFRGSTDVPMTADGELDAEAVLALNPDLVIGIGDDWAISNDLYAGMKAVVPILRTTLTTFNYPRGALRSYGALFGVEEAASAAVAGMDAFAEEGRSLIAPIVANQKVLVLYTASSLVALEAWSVNQQGLTVSPSAFTSPFFRELGMRPTDFMEQRSVAADRGESSVSELSVEQLGKIDADIVFAASFDVDATKAMFAESAVLATMPAVQKNQVYVVPANELTGGVYGTRAGVALAVEALTGQKLEWLAVGPRALAFA